MVLGSGFRVFLSSVYILVVDDVVLQPRDILLPSETPRCHPSYVHPMLRGEYHDDVDALIMNGWQKIDLGHGGFKDPILDEFVIDPIDPIISVFF